MKNLGRAIKRALRQRFTIAGVILSSLFVAFFWGANIGVVYPFVEVVVQNNSMHDWARERIAASEKALDAIQAEIAECEGRKTAAKSEIERYTIDNEVAHLKIRVGVEEQIIATTERLQPYIEHYLPDDAFQTLILIIVFVIVGTVIKTLFLTSNMMLVQRLSETTTLELRNQVLEHTMKMDLAVFNKDRTGDLISRFTGDIAMIGMTIAFLCGQALREPLKVAVCLIGAFYVSWQLMLFSLMIAPLAMFLTYTLAKSIKRANRRAMEESSQLVRRLLQAFSGMYVIKAYTMERYENDHFRRTTREVYRKSMKIMFYNSLTRFNSEVVGISILCVSILAGGYLVLNQETHLFGMRMAPRPLNLASLLLFYGFLIGATDPLRKLSGFLNTAQAGAAAADRIYPLLDREPTIVEKKNVTPIESLRQPIVFDHVNFHYDNNEPVLRDINLTISPDEVLAIVGPNGCGKTTLVNMIPRFYDPVDGAVRLGYLPLRDVSLSDLRRRIAVVTQRAILFDDTALNNIRYGSPDATEEEVMAAARIAHAHEFIVNKLEHGYETNVGESGGRLSGGQRQRICLARAILRDPEIMILDEATSQIDPESERLIRNALEKLAKNRTLVVITHRLSTLLLADRILVMDEGRIVDVGTHDELASRCKLYQRLYQTSFKASA